MHRIAVLTSGGDAPGMNYCVVSVARLAAHYGMELIGVIRGYNGIIREDETLLNAFLNNARTVAAGNPGDEALLTEIEKALQGKFGIAIPDIKGFIEKYGPKLCVAKSFHNFLQAYPVFSRDLEVLGLDTVLDIADRPGTHLRTARCLRFLEPTVRLRALVNLVALGVEGLIVIGGDGSFQGALRMTELGMPCVCLPATIDGDLFFTDMALGYDTAVNVCVRDIRKIRATSRSHDRPHVVEVMGRNCGNIALRAAAATGAEIVLVRENPWNIDDVAQKLQKLIDLGNTSATIVVAEGAYKSMAPFDVYGFLSARGKQCYPGEVISASRLASILKRKCKDADGLDVEVRSTVLGYTQRGDAPSAYDAAFAFDIGRHAVESMLNGNGNIAIGVQNGTVIPVPLDEVLTEQQKKASNCNYFNFELFNLINALE